MIGSDTFNLIYDAENRLIEVKKNSVSMASFVYDGDGRRVKSTINGTTTTFVGSHYEVTGSTVTKYYFAGAQRVAMRAGSTLSYLLSDHLGSTSITTNSSGALVSELRYKPWGETRYSSGTTPTKYQYTGQYSYQSDFGLLFYNARWYDPALGRFTSADTIVPGGVQGWDRYAYANNNPILYNDPSGHCGVLCAGIVVVATVSVVSLVFAAPFALSSVGHGPDTIGVATTMAFTNTNDAAVAAGLAVQSQYPWAMFTGGKGLAQATWKELMDGEKDPYSSAVAESVMTDRINNAINSCKLCTSGSDKLIVAAIAQNGYGVNYGKLSLNEDGQTIDWVAFFLGDIGSSTSDQYAQYRQDIIDMDYSAEFMVKLYIQDLRLLMKLGYELPEWASENDIKVVEQYLNTWESRHEPQ